MCNEGLGRVILSLVGGLGMGRMKNSESMLCKVGFPLSIESRIRRTRMGQDRYTTIAMIKQTTVTNQTSI